MELVFLLEEPSAKNLLDVLLPELLPAHCCFRTIPHEGKSDLLKSIPKKLRAWRNPEARFIVLHDQDANDCVQLKREIANVCSDSGRDDVLVRIVCRELEAWYFGDPDAVEKAYPKFKAHKVRRRADFRDPDRIAKPAARLAGMIPGFQKGSASLSIPKYMEIENNASRSFQCFVAGVRNICRA